MRILTSNTIKTTMKRLFLLLLFYVLTAELHAAINFNRISVTQGSACASVFPLQFIAQSNAVVSGSFTVSITDSAANPPVFGTVQKTDTDLILQIMDLPRERRLRQTELCGGFGEIQIFRHSHEIAKMTQLHIVTWSLAIPERFATLINRRNQDCWKMTSILRRGFCP